MYKKLLLVLFTILFLVISVTAGCKAKRPEQTTPEQAESENDSTQEDALEPSTDPSTEDETMDPSTEEEAEEADELSDENETSAEKEKGDDTSADKSDPQKVNGKEGTSQNDNTTAILLPPRTDYKWTYHGFAEYGHEMVLESINKKGSETISVVKGSVFDMSGGESNRDLSFTITYTAKPGVLLQNTTGTALMDTAFRNLELIRTPLKKGTSWTQKTKDAAGKEITLKSTITDVREENGQKIYTVLYKDTASDYYEKREIKERVGVLSYEKLYMDKEGNFTMGYYIYYPGTGFKNRLEINNYLPEVEKQLIYTGFAEYGHKGALKRISSTSNDAIYEFNGVYQDGSGIEDKFTVRYYIDYIKGTVTERVMSSTRFDPPEVNSKLHNVVILKTPFEQGKTWSHSTRIEGKEYKLTAEIKEFDPVTGKIKVTYTVRGVPGYFQNTYIEERTFELNRGMTKFANLIPGNIFINESDAKDSTKLEKALASHMFSYSLYEE